MGLMGRGESSTEGTATGRSGCSDHQSRPARRGPPVCAGSAAAQKTAKPMPPAMMLQYIADLDFCMTRVSERDFPATRPVYLSYSDCWPELGDPKVKNENRGHNPRLLEFHGAKMPPDRRWL